MGRFFSEARFGGSGAEIKAVRDRSTVFLFKILCKVSNNNTSSALESRFIRLKQ